MQKVNELNPIYNVLKTEWAFLGKRKKIFLFYMIFLLLFVQIVMWLFHGPARIMEQMTAFHVHRNYTNSKIKKVLGLPIKWQKDHHSGDTIDKINRAREGLYDFSESLTMTIIYPLDNYNF